MSRTRVPTLAGALVATLAILFPTLPLSAAEVTPLRGADLQQALYDVVVAIEKAGGMEPTASTLLYWNRPEVEAALEAIPNKAAFLEASTQIVKRSQAARSAGLAPPQEIVPAVTATPESGTAPYPPNYPDTSTDLDYLLLRPLGLVTSNSSRCESAGFAYYLAALAGAQISLTAAQLACDASGCDPTGIICISVCGATKIVQAGFLVARAPVDACNSWEGKLDAAENEAAYRNSVYILSDLSSHDDRIRALLAAQSGDSAELQAELQAHDAAVKALIAQLEASLGRHDARLSTHDADIKLLLDQSSKAIIGNEMEIIKLLKTPEGRRPGWGKEGY
ncbi:MAG: hypothetical protein WC538_10245 [Thermoanaerobaculia bacterium]|jgi:hypothetical protein